MTPAELQQKVIDLEEDRAIAIFERWQGWAREHALAEIEERLRGEAAKRRSLRRFFFWWLRP